MKTKYVPKIKPHLEKVYRLNPDLKSRKGYLRLDMNEGVPGLPQNFIKTVLSKIDAGYLATYPEYARLQKKIAIHNGLGPENIYLSNGSDAAIKNIFDAYISKGDKVLFTDPTFAMYPVYCDMFAAKPVIVEYQDDMSFPVESFIKKISKNLKMAVIVNPNNPTGSVIDPEDLLRIIKKSDANGVLTIVDEAYFYFYPLSTIDLVKRYKNLIVLRTFSKLCGLACVRLGYAVACVEIVETLKKVRPTYDVNGVAVLVAEELLDRPGMIRTLIRATEKGKRFLIKRLYEHGLEYKEGYANFVLIKCDGRANEMIERLANEKHILIGGNFRNSFLKGYIRVTVGSTDIMKRFWKGFIDIWENRKAK